MHILIKASDNYKGILIITHKEVRFLSKYLPKLKPKYHVLCHIGFNVQAPNDRSIDLYLISDSRCKNELFIPYTSRNFLPDCFNNHDKDYTQLNTLFNKYAINSKICTTIDFLYVGRCTEFKQVNEIFGYFEELNKKFPGKYTFCFVILGDKTIQKDQYYSKFRNIVKRNETEKNFIIFDTTNMQIENDVYMGLTSDELSIFYRNSKVYIHGCQIEGESRTIQEALVSGCICLLKHNMLGGGLDYIKQFNSVLYTTQNHQSKLIEAVTKFDDYVYDDYIVDIVNETSTIPKFLKTMYNKFGYDIGVELFMSYCNTYRLCFSLPAHNLNVKWHMKGKPTTDILNDSQFRILQQHI
jgi:hypothetical protein